MSENTVTFEYNCGDKLRDKVTGLEGIVMVACEYSTGCIHYAIAPPLHDGKAPAWQWLDSNRFELLSQKEVYFAIIQTKTAAFRFDYGDKLKDIVTGIEGIVMVKARYYDGELQYGVAPEARDSKLPDWLWLNSMRWKLVGVKAVEFVKSDERLGGAFPSGPES